MCDSGGICWLLLIGVGDGGGVVDGGGDVGAVMTVIA